MANNRMYLVNRRTGDRIYLAKYYPSYGWIALPDLSLEMREMFFRADFGHLPAKEQRRAQFKTHMGPPYAFSAAVEGAEWELQYETEEGA